MAKNKSIAEMLAYVINFALHLYYIVDKYATFKKNWFVLLAPQKIFVRKLFNQESALLSWWSDKVRRPFMPRN